MHIKFARYYIRYNIVDVVLIVESVLSYNVFVKVVYRCSNIFHYAYIKVAISNVNIVKVKRTTLVTGKHVNRFSIRICVYYFYINFLLYYNNSDTHGEQRGSWKNSRSLQELRKHQKSSHFQRRRIHRTARLTRSNFILPSDSYINFQITR